MTTAAELASYASSFPSFRNRIINGDMRIDQRNAGAAVTVNTGNQTFSVDRWFGQATTSAGAFTIQQSSTAPAGFANSLLITVTTQDASLAATDLYDISQYIEGFNVADLCWGTANAKTVTLSFWVRSSLTGTFGGAFVNSAVNRSYPFTYTIISADTWEQKTITVAGDTSGTWLTNNGIGLRLYLGLGVGSTYSGTAGSWAGSFFISATGATSVVGTSGATFYITGVQLEEGTVATPFEHRPIGTELSLCQRYFEKRYLSAWGYVEGSTYQTGTQVYWHPKRATPLATYLGNRAGGLNNYTGTDGGNLYLITNSSALFLSQGAATGLSYVENAEWFISAELD